MEYYLQSAEKGNSKALKRIGILYKKKKGVQILQQAALKLKDLSINKC